MTITLAERLDALDRVLAVEHLDHELVATSARTRDKARDRLRHGTDHVVVALAGSTGVGKSSLFNALVGDQVSDVGVRRPTTGVAHAAIWRSDSTDDIEGLLDWLSIGRLHHVGDDRRWAGLVLVDLPDFDSTESAHRAEVDRLIELVDAMVWVTDPQKYADELFHHGYVRRLAEHASVLHFVLNKTDTLDVASRDTVLSDFARRLAQDGIAEPHIDAMSADSGTGVDALSGLIDDVIAERRAVIDRLVADVRAAGESLMPSGTSDGVTTPGRRELVERLGHAAGADEAGDVVAAQHRKDGRMATGWPPVHFVERFRRRHPIADLPRASASGVARAEIDLALRDVAEDAAGDLGPPWPTALRSAAATRADDLTSQLTAITQQTARSATTAPRWWTPVKAIQRFVTLVAVVGAVWLLVAAVLGGFLQLDTDPILIDTPGLDWIPLPSLMVIGGLLVGLVLALLVRLPVAAAARRRGASVRRRLLKEIGALADDTVISDLQAIVAEHDAVVADLDVVTAR